MKRPERGPTPIITMVAEGLGKKFDLDLSHASRFAGHTYSPSQQHRQGLDTHATRST